MNFGFGFVNSLTEIDLCCSVFDGKFVEEMGKVEILDVGFEYWDVIWRVLQGI